MPVKEPILNLQAFFLVRCVDCFEMRKIKVGLIDSGINQRVIKGQVTQAVFCKENDTYSKTDINGHGTMCAKIIERMATPELDFVSAKIFHRELKAKERQIAEALAYMMDMQVDIINMSLSVSLTDSALLERLCRQLNELGIILISASANSGKKTLFEDCSNVITVAGSSFFDSTIYWYEGNRAVCDIEPILLPWYENEYDFLGGNSKAAALFTAIVINAENMETRKFDMDSVLKNAGKRTWRNTDICRGGVAVPIGGYGKTHLSELTDRWELMRCMERVSGISMEKLEQEEDWYMGSIWLTANQVQDILSKFITQDIIKIKKDAEIFMEYFRNQKNFLKFAGC